ncbi:MAG: GntR family transcriptional regulator [Thermomicrobiales bacterium]
MTPTAPQSASDLAYGHIRNAILTGTYEAGAMLGEVRLATEIGVSRTPIRMALARLQDEGWVTLYPKRGALVRGLTDRAVNDLVDVRYVLESTSVLRSTLARRAQMLPRLEQQIVQQHAALREADIPAFIDSTIAFHRSFVEAGENEVMLELYDRLADRQRYLLFQLGPRLLDRCDEIIAEHRDLVRRLADDEPVDFAECLRGHMMDTSGRAVRPLCIPLPS